MSGAISPLALAITAGLSTSAAVITAIITYVLTKRRERESDWRKLRLDLYREFVLAISGVVKERATEERHQRYADAVNSMSLVAPMAVLTALDNFQREISYINKNRSDERHDHLFSDLIKAMRKDIHPYLVTADKNFNFRLLSIPPENTNSPIIQDDV